MRFAIGYKRIIIFLHKNVPRETFLIFQIEITTTIKEMIKNSALIPIYIHRKVNCSLLSIVLTKSIIGITERSEERNP